ncbi:NAD(P)H-hydrate dehydratase [Sphingomonas mucosissima]|uniref:ADP-dependent (S)-NAD(P)H-hydrate dehydratase n=1 Tax=Sphingomonas mucosissima TaxID=370959 RepID=A0A245ZIM6_9SPHN|nr:NAD(P)H-hydrate dehydratase [Sphingomonas mucosissima]OWK29584.1 bifunctional NAD(P)H-hydrate repair enzyme Nnr [Sphingomonas mucosissima]
MIELDASWRSDHPIEAVEAGTDKDARGRLLVAGGSVNVPGAIALTGEAALRVGAGKIRMATVRSAALLLGVRFPEARVLALPEDADGEIADGSPELLLKALGGVDVAVIGPGITEQESAASLVRRVATADAQIPIILDAAAVACLHGMEDALEPLRGRLIMTPHSGEMAALLGCDEEDVRRDQPRYAGDAARRFGAVIVLKDAQTVVASPDGGLVHYRGGGPGLGTGGSGDVLVGAIGGLVARGLPLSDAASWGVWLHGEAGRTLAAQTAPIGFLARELLPLLPGLLPR